MPALTARENPAPAKADVEREERRRTAGQALAIAAKLFKRGRFVKKLGDLAHGALPTEDDVEAAWVNLMQRSPWCAPGRLCVVAHE